MKNAISRLVVLGTGNVGLPVVKNALARNLNVLAVSKDSSEVNFKHKNLQFQEIDLIKEGALRDTLKPNDTVIFCASDRTGFQEDIFKNSFKMFEEKGVERVVHTAGLVIMKVDGGKRLFETEEVQKNYPYFVKNAQMQFGVTSNSKVNWTEVVSGVVLPGAKTPESGTAEFWRKEWRLIEFAKPLEDLETLSIPLLNHYVMSEFLAEKIVDVAIKEVFLRQRIAYNNGLFVPK